MNDRMNEQISRSTRIWIILGIVIVMTILATLWAASIIFFPLLPFGLRQPPGGIPPIRYDIELFYLLETVVCTVNVVLSLFLLVIYVGIYEKTRSEFTVGLIILSLIILMNAFVSNPFVRWAFGYRPFGLGPFAFLPDLFTLGALFVLLYLSIKY